MNAKDFEEYLVRKKTLANDHSFWSKKAKEFSTRYSDLSSFQDDFLFNFLEGKQLLNQSLSVADIGCAVGRHAVVFDKVVGSYTGIDSSPDMIAICRANKEKYGLSHCTFEEMDWKKNEQTYDLVFASMCPAISSIEDVIDFMARSNRYCLVQRIIRQTDNLCDVFGVACRNEAHNHPNYAYGLINILWQLGYVPEVQVKHDVSTEYLTMAQVLDLFEPVIANMEKSEKNCSIQKLQSLEEDDKIALTKITDKLIIFWDKKIFFRRI